MPNDCRGAAQSRPPWASTIERQIDRPSPIPSPFVVKNGSKIWSSFSDSIPLPVSATVTVISESSVLEINCQKSLAIIHRAHRFNCVHDEVDENLLKLHAVGQHCWKIAAHIVPHRYPVGFQFPLR